MTRQLIALALLVASLSLGKTCLQADKPKTAEPPPVNVSSINTSSEHGVASVISGTVPASHRHTPH